MPSPFARVLPFCRRFIRRLLHERAQTLYFGRNLSYVDSRAQNVDRIVDNCGAFGVFNAPKFGVAPRILQKFGRVLCVLWKELNKYAPILENCVCVERLFVRPYNAVVHMPAAPLSSPCARGLIGRGAPRHCFMTMARLCADGTDRCARRDPPGAVRPGCRGAHYAIVLLTDSNAGRCVPRCLYFADALFGSRSVRLIFCIFYKKGRFDFCAEFCVDDFYSAADFCATDVFCAIDFALFCAYAPCMRAYVVRLLKCLRRSAARALFPARSLGLLPLFPRPQSYFCACTAAPHCACFSVFLSMRR